MKTERTGIRNGKLFCFNCGASYDMHLPQPIDMTTAMMKQFGKTHKSCKPTWKEPEVDLVKDEQQRANWWIANGETGSSSKTMWNCLMGNRSFEVNHPWDPDDFKRCYKLLEVVPEWKSRLDELRPLSKVWDGLVSNWPRLNEYYEEQVKIKRANGMYEFMKGIIEKANHPQP